MLLTVTLIIIAALWVIWAHVAFRQRVEVIRTSEAISWLDGVASIPLNWDDDDWKEGYLERLEAGTKNRNPKIAIVATGVLREFQKTELDHCMTTLQCEHCGSLDMCDCKSRIECLSEGMPGHRQCGWCFECGKPRFACGHLVDPIEPSDVVRWVDDPHHKLYH